MGLRPTVAAPLGPTSTPSQSSTFPVPLGRTRLGSEAQGRSLAQRLRPALLEGSRHFGTTRPSGMMRSSGPGGVPGKRSSGTLGSRSDGT